MLGTGQFYPGPMPPGQMPPGGYGYPPQGHPPGAQPQMFQPSNQMGNAQGQGAQQYDGGLIPSPSPQPGNYQQFGQQPGYSNGSRSPVSNGSNDGKSFQQPPGPYGGFPQYPQNPPGNSPYAQGPPAPTPPPGAPKPASPQSFQPHPGPPMGQQPPTGQFQPPPPASNFVGQVQPPTTGGNQPAQFPPPASNQPAQFQPPSTPTSQQQYQHAPAGQPGQYAPPPPQTSQAGQFGMQPNNNAGQFMPPQQPGQFPPQQPPQPGGFAPPQPGQSQFGAPPGAPGTFPPPPQQFQAPGGYQQQPPPPPGYPGAPGMATQAPRPRLDPENLPNAVQVIENDREKNTGVFNTSVRGQAPPLVTTEFVTEDAGCTGPRYIRAVSYTWPYSAEMVKLAGFPISVVVQPLAQHHRDERPLPVVNTGEIGPVRCRRCKAYMCPFMQFIDGGRRFQCKFCDSVTEVPAEYFAHLDYTGARYDRYERPELHLGSFEFTATKDYCNNQKLPQAPAYIFMIDVSYPAVHSGMVRTLCGQLKNLVLEHLPRDSDQNEPEIRVGFATYSTALQFYNLHPNLAQPQAFVVTDVKDVFVPLVEGFLVKVSESKRLIMDLLDMIPQLYADATETETILGPVIEAGLDAMKASERCGKLFVFHSSLPTFTAPGKLGMRDDRKLRGTAKEKVLLQPVDNYYSKVAQDCVAVGCGIDLFLFPNAFIDIATLAELPRVTGGSLYRYPYFQAERHGWAFAEDLRHAVVRPQGFDCVMRVRSSTGLQPINHYGNFNMTNSRDVEMGTCDSEKAVAVELKHDDKLSPEAGAYIQAALLYTTVGGRRRLRILNFAANVSSILMDVFRGCDLDSLINLMSKQAVQMAVADGPSAIREKFTNQVAHMLACYRKNCVSQSPESAAQLILPECMKCLPLYVNSLIKHDCFQSALDLQTDDRTFLLFSLNQMAVAASQAFFYPRLLPLHQFDPAANSHRPVPIAVRLSQDRLEENGIYVMENGLDIFIWLGEAVAQDAVQKLCGGAMGGAPGAQTVDVSKVRELPELDNQLSQQVRQVIGVLRTERDRHMRIHIIIQKKQQIDGMESVFLRQLCEDKTNGVSYVDYLCHLHTEIRQLLA